MERFVFIGIITGILTSCTLSFQNVSTHGTATDLIDEQQTTSPDIEPKVTIPVSAVPEIPIVSPIR